MFDPTISIVIGSIIFSIASLFINHKIGGKKRVKELQREVNAFQKQFEKATREKDEKEISRLKNIEPQVMGKMQEMLLLPLKAMIVILPLFLVSIAAIQALFPGFLITLPIGIHPSEVLSLNVLRDSLYGPRGFFIFCSIIANLALELIYSKVIAPEKSNELKK